MITMEDVKQARIDMARQELFAINITDMGRVELEYNYLADQYTIFWGGLPRFVCCDAESALKKFNEKVAQLREEGLNKKMI